MKRAPRTDANQTEIVHALRQIGCRVLSLAAMGKGVPDLLVGYRGRLLLMEIKDGTKAPSRRRLTDAQSEFHTLWGDYAYVVCSVYQALAVMQEPYRLHLSALAPMPWKEL